MCGLLSPCCCHCFTSGAYRPADPAALPAAAEAAARVAAKQAEKQALMQTLQQVRRNVNGDRAKHRGPASCNWAWRDCQEKHEAAHTCQHTGNKHPCLAQYVETGLRPALTSGSNSSCCPPLHCIVVLEAATGSNWDDD